MKTNFQEKNCSTMADPAISSPPANRPFFVVDLSGQNSNPMIPDLFITTHLNGQIQSTKLKLTSDASERTWEVELDGGRFAGGWKDFSVSHSVLDDDVLSFRHDGDNVFHVIPLGRSFSQIHLISTTSDSDEGDDDDDEHNIFDDDDDDITENADVEDDYENSTPDVDLQPKKIPSKKRVRREEESSSEKSYLVAHVTASSLNRDHLCLVSRFARSNGLTNRQCEIDLMNEDEKCWTLGLRHNKSTGQVFIRGGWRSFCKSNGIKAGSLCRFKLVQNGTKPVLQLCPNPNSSTTSIPEPNSSKGKEKRNASESDESEPEEDRSETDNKIVTIDIKPYMLTTSQLRLPASFTRGNGIEEPGEITVVDKDGVEWKLHLVNLKGRRQFYIRGYKDIFRAHGIKKVGDSFTLEAIRGGTSPVLKFSSTVKQGPFVDGYETPERTRVQKRARVSAEGGTSRCTRASNKSSVEPENLQHKQPLQPCSIADLVEKVKQSLVDTLTFVKRSQLELEIKAQNLEASQLEIDALGEKITEISKMFNINQA